MRENKLFVFSRGLQTTRPWPVPYTLRMLRARPLAPLAAGFVAGIALALFTGAAIPLVIAGLVASVLSIRRPHPAFLAILGLGLGALRQLAVDDTPPKRADLEMVEGRVQGPPRIYRSLADPQGDREEDGS